MTNGVRMSSPDIAQVRDCWYASLYKEWMGEPAAVGPSYRNLQYGIFTTDVGVEDLLDASLMMLIRSLYPSGCGWADSGGDAGLRFLRWGGFGKRSTSGCALDICGPPISPTASAEHC